MAPDPLTSCPACQCRDLFVRKAFPQRLGLGIVVLAGLLFLILAARPSTFYLGAWVLVIAVVADAGLWFFVPRVTVCYRCRAEYPGASAGGHAFELSVAEKYRQPHKDASA